MNYWANKDENRMKARLHTEDMETRYLDQIMHSANNTVQYPNMIYTGYDRTTLAVMNPFIAVDELDSVSAAYKFKQGKTCILNFASFIYPGGKFIEGSSAQEECLCHESFLYNVLSRYTDYYQTNRNCYNRALYQDRALYSPDIIFEHNGEPQKFDVLTCAAPNFRSAHKYGVSYQVNNMALKSRIKFIFGILAKQNVETAILGAFGCGVFKQNPYIVANMFKEYIDIGYNTCKNIIYPIPGGPNYQAFKEVFEK